MAALLALCMVGFTILVWKDRIWRVGARLLYTLVTLAALVFLLVVNFWHLWIIGW